MLTHNAKAWRCSVTQIQIYHNVFHFFLFQYHVVFFPPTDFHFLFSPFLYVILCIFLLGSFLICRDFYIDVSKVVLGLICLFNISQLGGAVIAYMYE